MFGSVESPHHWAAHLLRLRGIAARSASDESEHQAGITEFVPLPFVHMESPIFQKGGARRGPTLRECILLHAVSRLVLYPHITNIQVDGWVGSPADHRSGYLAIPPLQLGVHGVIKLAVRNVPRNVHTIK
jgi:2-iminoacetate synthase ThiH